MPDDLSFLDDDRDKSARRQFTGHDTLSFNGKVLKPISLGRIDLLQETGNRYFVPSDQPPGLADIAGFLLIHVDDDALFRAARAAAWSGRTAWREFVNEFLEDEKNSGFLAEIQTLVPVLRRMISDFAATQTKAVPGDGGKKKHGRRKQSPGPSGA